MENVTTVVRAGYPGAVTNPNEIRPDISPPPVVIGELGRDSANDSDADDVARMAGSGGDAIV
jgi:hypothetical protein